MANFSSNNKAKALYFLLFVSFIFIIYGMINFFSSKHFCRKIFGDSYGFNLNEKSKEILSALKSDVEIFVLLEKTQEYAETFDLIKNDMRRIITEYLNFKIDNKIEAEIINVVESSKKYSELCRRFGILPSNCIAIAANDKVKILTIDDFYRAQNGKTVAFQGEKVISTALQELSCEHKHVIYFLTGHGECELSNVSPYRGLSALKNFSEQKNLEVRQINLYDSKAIPEDAEVVVIAGAKNRFLGFEKEILRDFIDNYDGKLLITLDGVSELDLKEFLDGYGIFVGEELLAPLDEKAANYEENMVIRRFAPHEINNKLIEFRVPILFGTTYEVKKTPWFSEEDKIEITELLQTDDDVIAHGDEKNEIGASIIAVIAEKKKFDSFEITKNAGKILVIGNSDFLSNGKIKVLGNRLFWFGICDYMLHKEEAQRFEDVKIESYRLALSKNTITKIFYKMALLPIGCCCLCLFVAFLRRK